MIKCVKLLITDNHTVRESSKLKSNWYNEVDNIEYCEITKLWITPNDPLQNGKPTAICHINSMIDIIYLYVVGQEAVALFEKELNDTSKFAIDLTPTGLNEVFSGFQILSDDNYLECYDHYGNTLWKHQLC